MAPAVKCEDKIDNSTSHGRLFLNSSCVMTLKFLTAKLVQILLRLFHFKIYRKATGTDMRYEIFCKE